MTVRFSGQIKSKGNPPKWFNIPSWVRRMFVWDKSYPVSWVWSPGQQDRTFSASPFGVAVVFYCNDQGKVEIYVSGIPVFEHDYNFNGGTTINIGYAGQRIEGILEAIE